VNFYVFLEIVKYKQKCQVKKCNANSKCKVTKIPTTTSDQKQKQQLKSIIWFMSTLSFR